MENTLRRMYEFQRFDNNPRLRKMLDDALSRYSFSESEGELSDDDAALLNAAGTQVADPKRGKEEHS